MSENAAEGVAAGLLFLRGHRAGDRHEMDRVAIRADRCPSSLRKLRQPVAIPSMKADTRASRGNRSSSLAAISTARRAAPSLAASASVWRSPAIWALAVARSLSASAAAVTCPKACFRGRGLGFGRLQSLVALFGEACGFRRRLVPFVLRRRLGGFCVGNELSSRL